jgi:hypothetical protein
MVTRALENTTAVRKLCLSKVLSARIGMCSPPRTAALQVAQAAEAKILKRWDQEQRFSKSVVFAISIVTTLVTANAQIPKLIL